jgi:pyruvate/2-oxoglutarate dehydrogenase complex dihydrolipoamide acyltransferase (E2) component
MNLTVQLNSKIPHKTSADVTDRATGHSVAAFWGPRDVVLRRANEFVARETGPAPRQPVAYAAQQAAAPPPPAPPSASAAAMKLAAEAGVDLATVPHAGDKITKPDVEAYLAPTQRAPAAPAPAPLPTDDGEDREAPPDMTL